MDELAEKRRRIGEFLVNNGLDAVLLCRQSNFAWCTGGKLNYVSVATEMGVAWLLLTQEQRYIVTDNIEAPRIAHEELAGQGYELEICLWHEDRGQLVKKLTQGMRWGADVPYPGAEDVGARFAALRYSLTPEEVQRYRALGRECAMALEGVARELQPGLTEHDIAARIGAEVTRRAIVPIVTLVATDGRILDYRHPIPTDKRLNRYAMLVLCGRREGLVAALTRFVHFGPIDSHLSRRQRATAFVDATFIASTVPGAGVAEILHKGIAAYRRVGFADEWQLHHQGGGCGYEARDFKATPTCAEVVQPNQAFAWNPSITGTKSEDTIIAGEKSEIITATGQWPTIPVEINGRIIPRPVILEL